MKKLSYQTKIQAQFYAFAVVSLFGLNTIAPVDLTNHNTTNIANQIMLAPSQTNKTKALNQELALALEMKGVMVQTRRVYDDTYMSYYTYAKELSLDNKYQLAMSLETLDTLQSQLTKQITTLESLPKDSYQNQLLSKYVNQLKDCKKNVASLRTLIDNTITKNQVTNTATKTYNRLSKDYENKIEKELQPLLAKTKVQIDNW